MKELLFATSNPHKIKEVAAVLAPLGIDVVGLDSLDKQSPEPVEDGETFEANASIKAVAYAGATGRTCLADDSGLKVDALGGAPGVISARYASDDVGEDAFAAMPRSARDEMNNAKLLRELADVPASERSARFVCAMCLADPDGNVLAETRGTISGVIVDAPRGSNGFGYDPLLELPDCGLTSAELSPSEKNARSHRGDAARQMAARLESHVTIQ